MKWTDRIGRRLKLNDLQILMIVAESGSMGKAAKALGISQPSVSKAISDIEHTIGVRLLDRSADGAALRDYGRAQPLGSLGCYCTNSARSAAASSAPSSPRGKRWP